MYIDPSAVQQLVVFGQVAASGSDEEREAADADARVFLEVLWAAATPTARSAFVQAMQGIGSSMPWSALGPQPEGAPMRAPPAMELVLGAADLGEEGTPAYRVDALTAEGVKMVAALRGWRLYVIAAITAPAGWRLDRIDAPGMIGVATKMGSQGQGGGDQDKAADQDEPADTSEESVDSESPDDNQAEVGDATPASETSPAPRSTWELPRWGWVVGGLALAGGIGLSFVMRDKE